MKKCLKCGKHKPRDEFYKATKAKDGLVNHCKACVSGKKCICCGERLQLDKFAKDGNERSEICIPCTDRPLIKTHWPEGAECVRNYMYFKRSPGGGKSLAYRYSESRGEWIKSDSVRNAEIEKHVF